MKERNQTKAEAMSALVVAALRAVEAKCPLLISGIAQDDPAESAAGIQDALRRVMAGQLLSFVFTSEIEPRLSHAQRSFRDGLAAMSDNTPTPGEVEVIDGERLAAGALRRWKGVSPADRSHCGVLALMGDVAWREAATVVGQSRRVTVKGGGLLMFVSRPRLIVGFTLPPCDCLLGERLITFDGATLPLATDPEADLVVTAVKVGAYLKARETRRLNEVIR